MKTIVVIPTFNEGDNITPLLFEIFQQNISDLEVIVVDDNSPDGTGAQVQKLQSTYPLIHLIKRYNKLGLGSAYIAGFKKALALGADLIIEMDADLSHDPHDLGRLINSCQNGADLTIGSRKIAGGKIIGWNWQRRLMSNGAMWLSRFILRLKPRDVTAGFRCFKREVLISFNLDNIKSNGYAFQEELLYRTQKAGFVTKEIPTVFRDRTRGHSKLSSKDIREFFWTILRLKFGKN